jgi:hypothetical protein
MKKFYQKESYPIGDCFRTCLASIMECDNLEDIPNFMKDGESAFEENFEQWLNENNCIDITYEIHSSKLIGSKFNGQLCILSGKDTNTGIGHCVVGKVEYIKENEQILYSLVHNPLKNENNDSLEIDFCTFVLKRLDIK